MPAQTKSAEKSIMDKQISKDLNEMVGRVSTEEASSVDGKKLFSRELEEQRTEPYKRFSTSSS